MKKLQLSLLAVLFTSVINAQWVVVPSGTTLNKFESLYFFNDQTGIVSTASAGRRTTDGGNNWTAIPSPSAGKDLSFVGQTGYGASVVGMSMRKTVNGGATWTQLTPPTSNSLWSVFATSANTVYFGGTGGVVWKSTNGGTSFVIRDTDDTGTITDMVFLDDANGFVSSTAGNVLHTENGGISWTTVLDAPSSLNALDFSDVNNGVAVGSNGRIFRTTNGGSSWNRVDSTQFEVFEGVDFFNTSRGIAVGRGGLIKISSNGGATWTTSQSNTTKDLSGVFMTSSNTAWAVGDSGAILKNNNVFGTVGLEELTGNQSIQVYPSPFENQVTVEATGFENDANFDIQLFDIQGKMVISQTGLSEKNTVDVSKLTEGIYVVRIFKNGRAVYVDQIIK